MAKIVSTAYDFQEAEQFFSQDNYLQLGKRQFVGVLVLLSAERYTKGMTRGIALKINRELPCIIAGGLLAAFTVNSILVPNHFLSGGVSGLSILLHYLLDLPVGAFVLILNIPLFWLGKHYFPWPFIFRSLLGMLAFSGSLFLTRGLYAFQSSDLFLVSLLGGLGTGIGYGLIYSNRSTVGGTDIVSTIMCRKFSLGLGTINFAINLMLLSLSLLFFPLRIVAYTVFSMYITSLVVDRMQLGFNVSKMVLVISSAPEPLVKEIIKKLHRGVTLLEGQGGFTHENKRVILTTVSLLQLSKLKQLISKVDSQAFVIVTGTSEVLGRGFKTMYDEILDLT